MKKRLLVGLLVAIMAVSMFTTTAFAASSAEPETGCVTVNVTDSQENPTIADSNIGAIATQAQDILSNTQEINLQNVGDVQILEADDDGVLYIKLIEKSEDVLNISRSATKKTSSAVYEVKYTNWLGKEKLVVTITAEATWYDDGAKSYIENLHGEYDPVDKSYVCSWDDSHKNASDYSHSLALDISKGSTVHSYLLHASMYFTDAACTKPGVNVTIKEYI